MLQIKQKNIIQPRLKIGQPDDKYEREADRVADAVMHMPAPRPQMQPLEEEEEEKVQMQPELGSPIQMKPEVPQIQRMCPRCRERARQGQPLDCPECEQKLQMSPVIQQGSKGHSYAFPEITSQLQTSKGQGPPLPAGVQQEMAHKMEADFSGVHIHTDSKSQQLNQQLGAKAFTYGHDIYFNKGEYNPRSSEGKHLLAHELTHVRQQSSKFSTKKFYGQSNLPSNENLQLQRFENGESSIVLPSFPKQIQRQESDEEEDSGITDCMIGLVGGEFIENPGLCQIIIETLVGLIPYVDQVMDVRDLIAHIYYLAFRDQLDRIGRWIGVVFTLIGAIPEVGTVIKGVSKTIRRYADVTFEGAGNILRRIAPRLSEFGINLTRRADDLLNDLRRLLQENWDSIIIKARRSWNTLVEWFKRKVDVIPNFIISLNSRLQRARNGINDVRRVSGDMIEQAFNRAREIFSQLLEELQQRLGRSGSRNRPEIDPEVDEYVERSFERTFDQRRGESSIPEQTGRRETEYPYLNRTQLAAARRLLSNRLDEIPTVRRVWDQVTNQGERQLLTADNSRRLFNNHRNRFWRAVRDDDEARQIFESAGFVFPSRRTTAPVHREITGRAGRISLDHIVRRADDPRRALDADNLRMIVHGDNTLLENLQQAIPELRH